MKKFMREEMKDKDKNRITEQWRASERAPEAIIIIINIERICGNN